MAKVKITADKEKIKQRIDKGVDLKDLNILAYDFDNLYPQRLIDIVSDSGTAKTCLWLYERFVMGGGAKDVNFYKSKVNSKGLTVDRLLRFTANQIGMFSGFAWHFNFNALGEITDITPVNFEYCRLGIGGNENKIAVYDDWGKTKRKKFNKTDVKFIDVWNQSEVLRQIEAVGGVENYNGQIMYGTKNGLDYPLASYDAVLEDMITEAQTKRFKANTSSKNFLASHILVTGREEVAEGEDSTDFGETLKQFQGGDGSGTILWMERESNEEQIELKKVDIQNYDGLYEYTENSSRDNIIKSFIIPPVLLVRTSGALGTSKEIADATEFYNSVTSYDRLVIEEVLSEVFAHFHVNINPSGDYSILPLKVEKPIDTQYLQYFTEDEIRQSLGYEPRNNTL